jgi:FtsP/CotA-like multicopper oxidase with cupredoxin domain
LYRPSKGSAPILSSVALMMFSSLARCVLGSLLGVFLIQSSWAIPTSSAPPSNKVRFEVDLTWGPLAPDGFSRNTILTNGQFPGPPLEVDEGDDVEFFVNNNLPFAVTIHFHGIEQLNTPWSDGVPGLSQRPIQPGESFVYRWNANQYGTYWYENWVDYSKTRILTSQVPWS